MEGKFIAIAMLVILMRRGFYVGVSSSAKLLLGCMVNDRYNSSSTIIIVQAKCVQIMHLQTIIGKLFPV